MANDAVLLRIMTSIPSSNRTPVSVGLGAPGRTPSCALWCRLNVGHDLDGLRAAMVLDRRAGSLSIGFRFSYGSKRDIAGSSAHVRCTLSRPRLIGLHSVDWADYLRDEAAKYRQLNAAVVRAVSIDPAQHHSEP